MGLKKYQRLLQHIKNIGFKYQSLSAQEVLQRKESDTIVILGSGWSINEINEEQWRYIKSCDTMGMNLWFIHKFKPTFLNYHDPKYPEPAFKRMAEISEDYSDVIILLDERCVKKGWHPKYIPQAFPSNPLIFVYSCSIKKAIPKNRPIRGSDFHDLTINLGEAPYLARGSLTEAVHLAFQMDYKRIILAGVDLNTAKYFWECEKYGEYAEISFSNPVMQSRLSQMWIENSISKNMHPTMDWGGGRYHAVDTFLPAFNELVLKPNYKELFVASKKSLLYPSLPYHSLA